MRTTGNVKWFNDSKGFGFITSADGKDCFVHFSEIQGPPGFKSLAEGDSVEFEMHEGPKGKKAEKVVVLEKAPASSPPQRR